MSTRRLLITRKSQRQRDSEQNSQYFMEALQGSIRKFKEMTVNHRNLILSRSIVGSLVLSFLLFLLLIAYAPDSVAFSPNNYGWNGLQDVYSAYGMHPVNSEENL